uniref:YLP motif-containing protein 1 n=1 Tax=Cannabis sativa TaxID=3483 RepID=A0A803P8U3_CANSA
MEYQHHHQHPQQWRPPPRPPPIQGNTTICPTCSYSHFPFCPPPPSFPFHSDHAHYRPAFDPHRPPHPVNAMGNPNAHGGGFGHPGPYGQFAPQPSEYPGVEGDRNRKRPRVDDFGSGDFNPNCPLVDERRLKMIRDHGGVSGGSPVSRFGPGEDRRSHVLMENGRAESLGNEPPYSYTTNSNNNYHQPQHHHGYGLQHQNVNEPRYFPRPGGEMGHVQGPQFFGGQPPLPLSPPPPLPLDHPPVPASSELRVYSSHPQRPSSLFPVSSSAMAALPCPPIPETKSLPQSYFHNRPYLHTNTGFSTQESQVIHGTMPKQFGGEDRSFLLKHSSSSKPVVVDASQLFKKPHRATRPDHFVIILRGLPGSGKSYLAKMLRDVEVENGGAAPRIHSMDDYFMTEVEKVEESDASKSSGSVRGKKPVKKIVMEYCYEPEMEGAYRSSMLKAFKKTLEEGDFTFIIVDDRNLRVADFAQFWATAKSTGYEVYVLEASYKDPAGCAARNVHGFTLDDIQKMSQQWEEAPSFHLRLDVKSLVNGDDLKKSGIQEVDMAMDDEDTDDIPSGLQGQNTDSIVASSIGDNAFDDSSKDGKSCHVEVENATEVKDLGRSKWSNELDEDDTEQTETNKGKLNALSGLIQAYGKEAKSVRWGDQSGYSGFSLSATKKSNTLSLIIGPGAGYNLKSNPLSEDCFKPRKSSGEPKQQSVFQEQLRAEHESFKAVFSRRQQRKGLDLEEDA